jgi:nucleoid-associated protein YgaU
MVKYLSLVVLVAFAAGCGVKAQHYVMTKERTDVEATGNAGSLMGKSEYVPPSKKTRKVYVLEMSKPVPESEVRKIEQEVSKHTTEIRTETAPSDDRVSTTVETTQRRIVIPPIDDEPAAVTTAVVKEEGPSEAVMYTVQKDDTLQKIAKKFYNSYGKWVRIYDANKEKIKNPNFVKPGTVLTIPAVE